MSEIPSMGPEQRPLLLILCVRGVRRCKCETHEMVECVGWPEKIDIKNIISNVDMMSTTTTATCYPILCETACWKYNNEVFMAWPHGSIFFI